jgi:phosphomannomutase/phosphoglucomutase
VKINPNIFREYDIRGIVDHDLSPEVVRTLGRGMGTYFRRQGRRTVAVGRDCRLSSPEYYFCIADGLKAAGCHPVDLGTVPTPLLYFSIFDKGFDAGVMITGSHNLPEYNGFKLMSGKDTLYGETIQDVRRIIESGEFFAAEEGEESRYDIVPEYLDYVAGNIKLARSLKVVIDAGNGTGGSVAVPLFRRLGCNIIELYCDMDGRFPNHHPDPTLPEAMKSLIKTVLETGADFGIAYDGDADRIGVVDDVGKLIWGDQLLILFARDILPAHPGAAIISEVKATQVLYDEIARLGGRPIMWKTGHSLIKKKIREEGALVAGEMSGHMFFADRWFGFDDAIYSSARLAELVSRSKMRVSEMMADLPKAWSTPEIRIYASEEVKFKIVDAVRAEFEGRGVPVIAIDGVRARFPNGWGLVRASNTQAVLVLRFEADSPEALGAIEADMKGAVERAIQTLTK